MVGIVYKMLSTKLTPEWLLYITYTQGLLALYFLPQMHERYGYFIEILAIIIAIICVKKIWIPVVQLLCTFITYSYYYNYDQEKILPYYILSLFMLVILTYMVYETFTYQNKNL